MSAKAGYLKSEKNFAKGIGETLQKVGQAGYDFFGSGIVETGMETVGKALGSVAIPIPVVGGMVGKKAGEKLSHVLQYGSGLMGEVGKSIQDVQNGRSVGQEIKDVLNYVPRQVAKDWWDSELMQVVTGKMTVPDAIMKGIEDYSGVNLFSNKTHAWEDKHGNITETYKPGSKLVVGEWKQQENGATNVVTPTPDLQSNSGILGVHNGEIFYKGFDDARWAQIQSKK